MFRVRVENDPLITKTKKDRSGDYQQQRVYVFMFDKNGDEERYPKELLVFPPKDNYGKSEAYKPGDYFVSPASFRMKGIWGIELGFMNLVTPEQFAREVKITHGQAVKLIKAPQAA